MVKERAYKKKQNGKVIGTIGLKKEGKRFRITRMYVDKAFRGKGVGKRLVNKLFEYCKQNKINNLFLTTYTKMNSVGFYERMGFKIVEKKGDIIWMAYSYNY